MRERLLASGPPIKARPEARAVIFAGNYVPDILQHGQNGRRTLIWDGMSARGKDGKPHILSTPVQAELRRLARHGEWGDVGQTIISFLKYERIRDQIEGRGAKAFLDVALRWPDRVARGRAKR